MKHLFISLLLVGLFSACTKQEEPVTEDNQTMKSELQTKIEAYAPTTISADLSELTENQKKVVELLVKAGKIADEIFWMQTAPDAIKSREELKNAQTDEEKQLLEYVMINYGPYDVIYDNKRFYGEGPEERPEGGNFYPMDMTKEEFEAAIKDNKELKAQFESQYTTIVRNKDGNLTAVPYQVMYPQILEVAGLLDEAAQYADNASLKKYLELRAKALRENDYLDSDMAWMELEDNLIDVVIGPIENYEDGIFNYKTAYEAVVMVKDIEASKELDMFEENINMFEQKLPYDKKYIRESAGKGNVLQIVNVVYFGGDCQKGVKTIAASLPNDPRVHAQKGAKKSMYKNMMEAKFNKIVIPISEVILDETLHEFVDRKAFTSFVTLHEVSHTLGRGYVYGNDGLSVRKALKEQYSAIEECKADITAMHNIKIMKDMNLIDDNYVQKTVATFVAGLYRSIRFGIEEAHGRANMIQLNYLREKGAIVKGENGKYTVNNDKFFDVVSDLAGLVLTIEAEGDYDAALKLIADYGHMDDMTKAEIESLNDVPRDLDTVYEFAQEKHE